MLTKILGLNPLKKELNNLRLQKEILLIKKDIDELENPKEDVKENELEKMEEKVKRRQMDFKLLTMEKQIAKLNLKEENPDKPNKISSRPPV